MIKRLRDLRLDKNFTQKSFAALLNLTQQTYSDYETGRTNPDLDTLTKIADFLGVSIDYLLGRSDDFGIISINNEMNDYTAEERQLVADYRALTPALKDMLQLTLQTWKGSPANATTPRRA